MPEIEKLGGDYKTDVLIVGGGMAGLMCARLLTYAGVECAVVEKGRICGGVTKNTTAKITAQHGAIYSKLIKTLGREKAQMYLKANLEAVEGIADMCKNIDCNFERKDAFLYSGRETEELDAEADALKELGYNTEIYRCDLPFEEAVGIKMPNQAQFEPLKFLRSLVNGLTVFENTEVISIKGSTAFTDTGKISAERIIVTTHFPFINTKGLYSLKMYQERSYVTALENACDIGGIYTPIKSGGISMRNAGEYLLIGGFGGRTGSPCGAWDALGGFAKDKLPDAKEKYRWAAQDCMALDSVPYIGRYSASSPQLYVATGFNKWGMTSSFAAASVLRDMITTGGSEYADLFNPQRSMMRKQLLINGFKYASSLLKPFGNRCPHLGCRLEWNGAEHSWDCPCHGSRFAQDGKLLDNPATGGKHMKNERADKMNNDKKIVITTRDRVLRAWQNSTELVRDFENYAKETSDDKTAAEMFQKYAVDEGRHAAELLKLLHNYQDNGTV